MSIQIAQQARANQSLDKEVRYPEGIMTKREWIVLKKSQGATVEESTKNRVQFNRTTFNRMTFGQEEYEKKCAEKVPCYNLNETDSSFYHISKAEFDFFNTL